MYALALPRYPGASPQRISRSSIVTVIAAHALVVFWLLHAEETIRPPSGQVIVSVRLLPPAEAPKTDAEIVPPNPKPVARKPLPIRPPTQFAAPSETPAPTPLAAPPAPAFIEPLTPAATPPAPTQTPPQFEADYLNNPKPPYPALSRRLGEQGSAVLRVSVAADGVPQDIKIHTSSGSARLDNSALKTVRRWKFVAAKLGNEAVAATVLVPIVFSLKD